MQGVAESPEIAKQLQGWQNPNNPNIPNYFHGFGGRMMGGRNAPFMFHRGFGIFSVFSIVGKILIFLLIAFLFMGMVRLLFFHPWRHPYAHWQGHMPPWAQQPDVQTPTQAEKPQEESK
jgi:predicted lipid-binding transport protein (Tim44 family)